METYVDRMLDNNPVLSVSQKGQLAQQMGFRGLCIRLNLPPLSHLSTRAVFDLMAERFGDCSRSKFPDEERAVRMALACFLFENVHPIKDTHFLLSDQTPREVARAAVIKFVEIAKGREMLTRIPAKHITIADDLMMRICYAPDNKAGIGAFRLFLKDRDSADYVPTYAVRGNPQIKSELLSFSIREVQPWLSENNSISTLKNRKNWEERYPREVVNNIANALRGRQRLLDKFIRSANKGDSVMESKLVLNRDDLVLLTVLAYGQASGITAFEGIGHRYHPLAEYDGKLHVNYDQLFGKWFDPNDQRIPPYLWSIDKGYGRYFIPHFNKLAATARRMLIDIATP